MRKLYLILFLFNLGNVEAHSTEVNRPTLLEFAKASNAVYSDQAFDDFTISQTPEGVFALNFYGESKDNAFKVVTYLNEKKKVAIVAIRGTDNEKAAYNNWKFNIGEITSGGLERKIGDRLITHGALAMAYGSFSSFKGASHFSAASTSASALSLIHASKEKNADKTLMAIKLVVKRATEIYGSENTYVTGHSLGGFLAQLFAYLCDIGGASFNAPALGFYRSNDFESQFHSIEEMYHQNDRVFENHRLDGDVVSLVNTEEGLGHFGEPVITHLHNFWNLWELKSGPLYFLKFHDMNNVIYHLKSNYECYSLDNSECNCEDRRSEIRKNIAKSLGYKAAKIVGLR